MKRIVTFDGEKAAKRFEMVRTALLNAGDGKAERNRARVRSEAKLMDALDAISVPKDEANPDADRTLKTFTDAPLTLTLDQAEHKLIEDYLSGTPWRPQAARVAVDAQDWWETAEKEEK